MDDAVTMRVITKNRWPLPKRAGKIQARFGASSENGYQMSMQN